MTSYSAHCSTQHHFNDLMQAISSFVCHNYRPSSALSATAMSRLLTFDKSKLRNLPLLPMARDVFTHWFNSAGVRCWNLRSHAVPFSIADTTGLQNSRLDKFATTSASQALVVATHSNMFTWLDAFSATAQETVSEFGDVTSYVYHSADNIMSQS